MKKLLLLAALVALTSCGRTFVEHVGVVEGIRSPGLYGCKYTVTIWDGSTRCYYTQYTNTLVQPNDTIHFYRNR